MSDFDLLGALSRPASASRQQESPQASGPAPCSRKGCREAATWMLSWNNPRIHTPERTKVWLACDEHRAWLANYLEVRGFLREVSPFPPANQEI